MLDPLASFFKRIKINKFWSITFTMLIAIAIILALSFFIIWQLSGFSEWFPLLIDKFSILLNDTINFISSYINIDKTSIYKWIADKSKNLLENNSFVIGKTIFSFGNSIFSLILIPVYVFLILFYKKHFLTFVRMLFAKYDQEKVNEVISKIKVLVQRYLLGLILELIIVAVLNSVGLLIVGIEYAILLGVIGALLNIIPYLGGLIAVVLTMLIALVTMPSMWYSIYVLIVFMIVQLLDNYIIMPKIVSSQVKINAFFSIIIVLAGNALWGIAGMFLSIPLLAIMKLIFDNIENLKPWGFLLGDEPIKPLNIKSIMGKKPINKP